MTPTIAIERIRRNNRTRWAVVQVAGNDRQPIGGAYCRQDDAMRAACGLIVDRRILQTQVPVLR